MPSTQISQTVERNPPPSHPLRLLPEPLLELKQMLPRLPALMSHLGWIDPVEHGPHLVPHFLLPLHDLRKLIQAPAGGSIVLGENHDRGPGLLDHSDKLLGDGLATAELLVNESDEAVAAQGIVQEPREALPGVHAPEAQEHIKVPACSGRR